MKVYSYLNGLYGENDSYNQLLINSLRWLKQQSSHLFTPFDKQHSLIVELSKRSFVATSILNYWPSSLSLAAANTTLKCISTIYYSIVRSPKAQHCYLQGLPHDLIFNICRFLTGKEISQLSGTSRKLYKLLGANSMIWKDLLQAHHITEEEGITAKESLKTLNKVYYQIRHHPLTGVRFLYRAYEEINHPILLKIIKIIGPNKYENLPVFDFESCPDDYSRYRHIPKPADMTAPMMRSQYRKFYHFLFLRYRDQQKNEDGVIRVGYLESPFPFEVRSLASFISDICNLDYLKRLLNHEPCGRRKNNQEEDQKTMADGRSIVVLQ